MYCFSPALAVKISIHALLAESDQPAGWQLRVPGYFYPRSPCGERPGMEMQIGGYCEISIHALLAESDAPLDVKQQRPADFYPRSPCGERQCHNARGFGTGAISIHALLAESDLPSLILG